jgi:hypothetical protein
MQGVAGYPNGWAGTSLRFVKSPDASKMIITKWFIPN